MIVENTTHLADMVSAASDEAEGTTGTGEESTIVACEGVVTVADS
jgi:hypothetical protein